MSLTSCKMSYIRTRGNEHLRPKTGILYRYAKAFLLVLNKKAQDSFIKKFDLILTTLKNVLHDTHYKQLSLKDKNQILILWAKECNIPMFESFIQLIIENNETPHLTEILHCVFELYCNMHHIQYISITTAQKLTLQQKTKIESQFKKLSQFIYHVNKNILGGSVIKENHTIKDTSILSYLQDIQSQLLEAL